MQPTAVAFKQRGQADSDMTIEFSRQEPDSDFYKTLVESTKAIPWSIDWESTKFSYIGPQIEALLGWTPESWVGVEDWAARMHPEDRASVVSFCIAQSQAGADHEADYRALTRDGGYVWIRDVVHVVRDEKGNVSSLVGFMFDITERKQNEEKLAELQRTLVELSYKDGLTGVANRRMFDSVIEKEWVEARRSGQPLSLIMLDIDYFKQYNDHYGHIQGDECLRRVAQALLSASTRARDFLGRFGGEEFILVLPEADAQSAARVAERCRKLILDQGIAHVRSGVCQLLTISAGVATIIPSERGDRVEFIELVDKRLYQAKQEGRNCVVSGAGH
jgi:diguanylate cyclase (GGDEF)-like protein/PAS domain S-box-containing protein